MDTHRNIALMGKSGTGKTTVAKQLVSGHGYHRCTPGDICRQVCSLVFGKQERSVMNKVTELLKTIDNLVWLKAAMANAPPGRPLVYDSMRFADDYDYLRNEGFEVWLVESREDLRHERLKERGQIYTDADEEHPLEVELSSHHHHQLINNDDHLDAGALARQVADLLRKATRSTTV
jgi:dephospho-CoA kinase